MTTQTILEGLRVHGQGFLGGLDIPFSPSLNCLIGARGTGKTSVLELIRFATGRESDSERTEAILSDLVPVALGTDGDVELDLTTPLGEKLTIRRDVNTNASATDRESGEAVEVSWPALGLYELSIFSQNQLEDIATSPPARLSLVDSYCRDPLRTLQQSIQDVKKKLDVNAVQLTQLANEVEALKLQAEQLPKLSQEAQVLEKQYMKALGELQAQEPIKKRVSELSSLRQAFSKEDSLLSGLLTAAEAALLEPFPGRLLGDTMRASLSEESITGLPSLTSLRLLRDRVVESSHRYAELRSEMKAELTRVRELVHEASTGTRANLHKISAEYQQSASKLGVVSKTWKELAAKRENLLSQIRILTSAQSGIEEKERQRQSLVGERNDLLKRFSELRQDRFQLRKEAADDLNEAIRGTVRISITESGALAAYQAFLLEQLRGSGLWYSRLASAISQRVPPTRLAELAVAGDADTLAGLIEVDPERARRALGHLSESDVHFRMQAIDIEDSVTFRLRVGDNEYQDSEHLSQGQKCTTLLTILLVDSANPLVVDQPEDNLDNSYVVDSVVEVVRQQKPSRQFIFVTHNPNIPVLGEAEQVVAMEAESGTGRAALVGVWDDPAVKRRILTIMEGGQAAFERRRLAYETVERRPRLAVRER